MAAEPINTDANEKAFCVTSRYYKGSGNNPGKCVEKHRDSMVAEPVACRCRGRYDAAHFGYSKYECRADSKANTLTAERIGELFEPEDERYIIERNVYGIPTKSVKDGKEITIYEVRDGKITIKGKQYPIKLKDGYYIIRKLTVSECKRLQTVPEWYEFPVSNSQAYKMLGNGWTCEVIAHLIRSCNGRTMPRKEQE